MIDYKARNAIELCSKKLHWSVVTKNCSGFARNTHIGNVLLTRSQNCPFVSEYKEVSKLLFCANTSATSQHLTTALISFFRRA